MNVAPGTTPELSTVQLLMAQNFLNLNVVRDHAQEGLVRRRDHVADTGLKDLGQR